MDDPSRFGNTSPSSDVTSVSDHARNGYDNVSDDERSSRSEHRMAAAPVAFRDGGPPAGAAVPAASSGETTIGKAPELAPVSDEVADKVRHLYTGRRTLSNVAAELGITLPQAYEALARHLVNRDKPLTAATVRAYLERGWPLELIAAQRHTTVGQLMLLLGEDPEPSAPTGPGAEGSA